MRTIWTVEKCLERACRLTLMADEASDYQQILTYDGLAREWLKLAARASREWNGAVIGANVSPFRRFIWREFGAWFR